MSGEEKAVILADWGNSSGRLFCVRGDSSEPEVIDRKRISGAKDTPDSASAFAEAVADWRSDYDISDAWLCGAVTSNIGWLTTTYTSAPSRIDDIQVTSLQSNSGMICHFLQGTSITKNQTGFFDTVRGEDMQAHGWVALTGMQDGYLCLPGTHTKWIRIQGGAIVDISTGVTGETFEVLDHHSILTRGARGAGSDTAFRRGLDVMQLEPRPALTHMLMSVRTLQLNGEMKVGEARDYLSGLLIGEDCAPRMTEATDKIHIIGDGPSADRYADALTHYGTPFERHDGQACVIAGLQAVRRIH